jgi:SAM-dependent methyltransferase
MVRRSLLEPLEEVTLEAEIPAVGVVENPVSRAVREQYQANPYPRWLTPAYRTPGDVHGILRGTLADFEPPDVLRGPIRVLVVGCGTGHHAISIALRYANAEVLATDLSRRSLAFGLRMARLLGVGNVRFVENDLLDLSKLDGEFHIIECVGVLHHMQSIADGLRILVGKLHVDGLMKIGLYSESAREPVVCARQRIAELGLTAAADDIRRFRSKVLSAPEDDPLRRILGFGDFYTLSNCRDLLFHVHEQHVSLDGIRTLLAAAGLRFIGFESADRTLSDVYRRHYPEDTAMRDLSRWEVVEQETPGAFSALYQFWCAREKSS